MKQLFLRTLFIPLLLGLLMPLPKAEAAGFSSTGNMGAARVNFPSTLLPNGKVLIAGGSNSGVLASAELYDPAIGTFSPKGSISTARQ